MSTQITSQNRDQRFGQLTHSAGNISLAPSVIHIGALQYTTDTTKLVALPSLVANSRYQVYAVDNGASDVELVISTNENSMGPAGYNKWKLVGSLYANGIASPAFGSFVPIKGVPTTEFFSVVPTGSWTGAVTYTGKMRRNGDYMDLRVRVSCSGAPTGAGLDVNIPTYTIDYAKLTSTAGNRFQFGHGHAADVGNTSYRGFVSDNNTTSVQFYWIDTAASAAASNQQVTNTSPFAFGNTDFVEYIFSVPIVGWNTTPIEEL